MSGYPTVKTFDPETYEMLVAYNGDILFEWNLVTDRFYATPNLFDIFGYMPASENFTATLEKSENIHPDDKNVIKEYLETIQFTPHNLKNGKYYSNFEIRIRNIYHSYIWCKLRLIADYSGQNMPYKISGMITHIDNDKTHRQALPAEAQKDSLTGLYNKETTTRLMQEWLTHAPAAKSGALVRIDIDGLKAVNAHFGRVFGDAILADAAATIQTVFLASDIIGRVGGDAFAVFIKEIYSLAMLKKNLKRLNLRLMHAYKSGETTCNITASIGVALYPAHGKSFHPLFENAGEAMRYIKEHGQDQFMLYRERLPKTTQPQRTPEKIAPIFAKSFDDHLHEYIFKILYTTKDSQAAIQMLLTVLGKKLRTGRAYLYRRDDSGQFYHKAFEWCDASLLRSEDALEKLPATAVDALYAQDAAKDHVACDSIPALPQNWHALPQHADAKAFLHGRLIDNNVLQGWIGFDECASPRIWTSAEINIVTFLAGTLTAFFQQEHRLQKLTATRADLQTLLLSLDACLYVVDRNTHDLLFVGEKIQRTLAQNWTNKKCYETLYARTAPCEDCPMRKLAAGARNVSSENADEQNQPLIKSAYRTAWDGRPNCCLLQLETLPSSEDENTGQ